MIKLTRRWANALMEYAEEHGLDEIYREVLVLVSDSDFSLDNVLSEPLCEFLKLMDVGEEELKAVLYAFLDLARKRMNFLQAEIISAVPLTSPQLEALSEKLKNKFRKQLDITATVDPSLLGGLRVIVGDTVIDDSIKRKLADMKSTIYEGVKQWI